MSLLPDSTLQSGLAAVQSALKDTGAVGFLQVDRGDTPSRRYLTRTSGANRETALVVLPATASHRPQAVYCVPNDSTAAAKAFVHADDRIDRSVVGRPPSAATGRHVCKLLADRLGEQAGSGRLLVPRDLPHDAAVFCQQTGYELQSTAAVRAGRASKTLAERDCLTAVQQAAGGGLARGEAVLAASNQDGGTLSFNGQLLSAERLCRLIDTALVSAGVAPAENTQVGAPTESTDALPVGEPIRLRVAPRGPHGYHGTLTRTVVIDSDGGWERRAYIAAEAGLQAAVGHIEPGVDVSTVKNEALAEVGAYGFAITPDGESTQPRATAAVHGVGLSAHEWPTPGAESTLQVGTVIAVETGVVDTPQRTVRLGTLHVVTAEGCQQLVEYPFAITPTDRGDDGGTKTD